MEKIQMENHKTLLHYFRMHPERFDPCWCPGDDGHSRAESSANRVRMYQFCFHLSTGGYEYRTPRKKLILQMMKRERWPGMQGEKDALASLKGMVDMRECGREVLLEPFYSRLKVLVPSAVEAYRDGVRRAVFDLARVMPGLLLADVQSETGGSGERERYLASIIEFQKCFRELIASAEIRSGRDRKIPMRMRERAGRAMELVQAGIDKFAAFALLRIHDGGYANLPSELWQVRKKVERARKEGFFQGQQLEEGLRGMGLRPSKLTFCHHVAHWIVVQYRTRRMMESVISQQESDRKRYDEKELRRVIRKCEQYLEDGRVRLLPGPDEMVNAAVNYWPGLKKPDSKGGEWSVDFDPYGVVEDLLKIFKELLKMENHRKVIPFHGKRPNGNLDLYGLFMDAAFILSVSGFNAAMEVVEKAMRSLE